ncbi:MAG: alpha/beta hydrolase [Novosphingobium sp.]|nr:alpha/beta hydrolase [Novosphingobium sp.]
MTEYNDCFWSSLDGLKLHYREYPGREDRPPVICLPGLTRNARDFENLAEHLSGEWRVLCPEMRGRGDSEYAKDPATYNPLKYVEDIGAFLSETGIERFVSIGTSLGALMTLALGMIMPDRIAAAVLNDAGPVIEPEGLERISSYVGQARNFPTWMHAARALEETQGIAYPDYEIADWLALAKRLMVLNSNGRVVFDYDMKLAEPFNESEPPAEADLWPGVSGLAGKPVLILRGELSDILSNQTVQTMVERMPGAEAVTVPRVGHAPTLDEPEAVAAIDSLLARVA